MFGYRKLSSTDVPRLADHLIRLPADDRRCRFGGSVSDDEIRRYCHSVDWRNATIVGYFHHNIIRAAAELRFDEVANSTSAEAAFSVEHPFQGHGTGTKLMRRIITVAQNSGIQNITVVCLPENGRMRSMLAKHHASFKADNGEIVATIRLYSTDPISIAQEVIDASSGFMPIIFGQILDNTINLIDQSRSINRQWS